MEITVQVVSCLLGTCFVIDYWRVPVESKVLINERGKKEGRFRHRELALCNLLGFYSYSDANICHYNLIKTLPSLVQ